MCDVIFFLSGLDNIGIKKSVIRVIEVNICIGARIERYPAPTYRKIQHFGKYT